MATCSMGTCNWINDFRNPERTVCTNCQREFWLRGGPEPTPPSSEISEVQATFFFAFVMLMVLALLSGQPERSQSSPENQSALKNEAIASVQMLQRSIL